MNGGFFDEVFSLNFHYSCKWLPLNHFFFQVANIFLVVTYLAPSTLKGLFLLRFALAMAGFFFGIWGALVLCAFDTMLWNIVFAFGNVLHAGYVLFRIRPRKFDKYNERIYTKIFETAGVKRFQYQPLAMLARMEKLHATKFYARQGFPVENRISLLLDGRVDVTLHGHLLHSCHDMDFIDAPEWVYRGHHTKYQELCIRAGFAVQVSMQANCDSLIVWWERSDIEVAIKDDLLLQNIFQYVVNRNIVKKLFCVHDVFLSRILEHESASHDLNSTAAHSLKLKSTEVDTCDECHRRQENASANTHELVDVDDNNNAPMLITCSMASQNESRTVEESAAEINFEALDFSVTDSLLETNI